MTATTVTEAERLRALLRDRKAKKDNPGKESPLRFPYMLDPDLANRVRILAEAFDRLEQLVDMRREQLETADEAGGRDLRASGDDTTPAAAQLAAAEAELERIKGELEEAVAAAAADRFYIEFKPCGDKRYTHVLAAHPNADGGTSEDRAAFLNALLAECFWKFTNEDGEELPLFDSWAEFMDEAEPEFGEMDAWRTAVMVACNRNPHRLLPR